MVVVDLMVVEGLMVEEDLIKLKSENSKMCLETLWRLFKKLSVEVDIISTGASLDQR